ncbi:kinase domain-containing protein [Leptodontidium sp. 2 PMI_412]|nr:kinase domain-containing protein [Leptodontidium sp. 2 PMI_412]
MLLVRRCCTQSAGMAGSTFVSSSGFKYIRGNVLKADTRHPEKSLFLAHCEGRPFVLKTVSPSVFEQSNELKREFEGNTRFRHHIDENEGDFTLVYEWFRDDLLQKWILRETGEALRNYHAKNWIDIDVKPDNVFVNWSLDEQGQIKPERVALGDLDCSLQLEDGDLLRIPNGGMIGNVMWCRPEQLTGQGIGKPSDVFAFGLICLFVITTQEKLHPNFQELDQQGTPHREALMIILLAYFGPVPQELITHINDEVWAERITKFAESLEGMGLGETERLENWPQEEQPDLDFETKRFISRMTNLDPAKRATMEEVMADPWWNK